MYPSNQQLPQTHSLRTVASIALSACLLWNLIGCATGNDYVSTEKRLIQALEGSYLLVETTKQYIPKPKKYLKDIVKKIVVIYPQKDDLFTKTVYKGLQAFLMDIPTLKVIERHNIETIVRELEIQLSGLTTKEDSVKMGRMLGASHILSFDIDIENMDTSSSLKNFVSIPIRIYNVETTETEYYFNAVCGGGISVYTSDYELDEIVYPAFKKGFEEKPTRDSVLGVVVRTADYHAFLSLQKAFQSECDFLGIGCEPRSDKTGVNIIYVAANSPAEKAGLDTVKKVPLTKIIPQRIPESKKADPDYFTTLLFPTLLEIDDIKLANTAQLDQYLETKSSGDVVKLKVRESGKTRTVKVTLQCF